MSCIQLKQEIDHYPRVQFPCSRNHQKKSRAEIQHRTPGWGCVQEATFALSQVRVCQFKPLLISVKLPGRPGVPMSVVTFPQHALGYQL